jgi:RNA polymerase sigma-70 factor (ECF subfamily)
MNRVYLTDSELITSYGNGSEHCLAILIERHQSKIFSFIYSKTSDRELSNDIFQDTFVKVIHKLKLKAYNDEGKFTSWVMRIAHNLIIDHYRNESKVKKMRDNDDFSILETLTDGSPTIENFMVTEQINQDVVKLIDFLPYDQQEVLKMRIYDDMSFQEIADIIDVSINTALGRMRYAVINLRKLIEKHQIIVTN